MTLRYDKNLQGTEIFRLILVRDATAHRLWKFEATVKVPDVVMVQWINESVYEFTEHVPTERDGPALLRVSETTWRLEPWATWIDKYQIPKGTSFLLVDCPAVWPLG